LWAQFFAWAWVLARQALIASRHVMALAALALAGAAVNVGLNFWLIPAYGATGAAWASLVAYATPIVAGVLLSSVRQPFRSCFVASLRPAAATAVVIAVLLLVRSRPVVLVPVFVMTTPLALLATRSLSIRELKESLL